MLPIVQASPLATAPFGISNASVAMLVCGVATIFVINRWRRNTVNKQRSKPAPTFAGNPLSVREISTEIAALLGEVEETSRRLTAQIDNRYRRLEQLLGEADEKIRRLEGLSATGVLPPSAEPAPLSTPAKPRPQPIPAKPRTEPVSDSQRVLARLRSERGAPPPAQDPAYQPIYTLADGGKSPREIAQQLGRQPGEVELILALRQR